VARSKAIITARPDVVPSIERNLMDRGILANTGGDTSAMNSPRVKDIFATPVRDKSEKDDEDLGKAEHSDGNVGSVMALGVDSVHLWDRNKSQYGRVGVDVMRRALQAAQPAIFSDANLKLIVTRGARTRSQQRLLEYLEFLAPCVDATTTIPSDSRSDIGFIDHVPLRVLIHIYVHIYIFIYLVAIVAAP
jgi:hypothetical protein